MAWRKSYSRGRYSKRNKYSVEHTPIVVNSNDDGNAIETIVAPVAVQGMRKVKNLTVSLSNNNPSDVPCFWWAVVYVPAGTTPSPLTVTGGSTSLYEPNQFVMECGYFDPNAGPLRVHTRLARNLNSGDGIALILRGQSGEANVQFRGVVSYAITLQ